MIRPAALRRLTVFPRVAVLPLALLAAGFLAACSGARTGCGCEAPAPCGAPGACAAPVACDCPCPAPAPCSPCGPRPAHAKAGEAWCCVWIPPVDGVVDEQVCVKPASTRSVYVPPTYGTRIRLVCDAPPRVDRVTRPGVYTVEQRDVMLKPGSEKVVPICCPPGNLAPGEVQAECVVKTACPPVWGKECSRVCLEPDRTCVEFTPAKYRCEEERYMISPGFTQHVCEPAVYEPRQKKVCLQPGRWEWRMNDKCVLPPPPLQALQLEMIDNNADGSPGGIFKVGTEIRYDVTVTSDTASGAMQGLTVHFQLPPEVEFVAGSGDNGLAVTGAGQSAHSGAFNLAGDQAQKLNIRVRVKGVPALEQLQVQAVVKGSDGTDLAVETESSSVPKLP